MKVVSIVGARPNFVKLAAVADLFDRYFEHVVIHTGQHYDYEMSSVFFKQLEIREPDYYLGVGSGTHGYQVGEMVKRVEDAILREKPDIVVVYGDTNSTLAGAIAAAKAGFMVGHVEAGLRSHDVWMQEEINRRATDHVSHYLFAPTDTSVENLLRENVPGEIYLTGDVHVDVLRRWMKRAVEKSDILGELGLVDDEYMVATIHRAENTDDPARLSSILRVLGEASKTYPVVFPVHPRTMKAVQKHGLTGLLEHYRGLMLIEPLGYIDFIRLLMGSRLVFTDSGGVQREAYLLGKRSIVFRDRTEWVELVKYGWVRLADTDPSKALKWIHDESWRPVNNPYLLGDGRASEKIVRALKRLFQ